MGRFDLALTQYIRLQISFSDAKNKIFKEIRLSSRWPSAKKFERRAREPARLVPAPGKHQSDSRIGYMPKLTAGISRQSRRAISLIFCDRCLIQLQSCPISRDSFVV
jgi:hypothetical protein